MLLDRELQLELLQKLSSTYPKYYDLNKDYKNSFEDHQIALINLYYLMQHGLVEEYSLLKSSGIGGYFELQFECPTITHKGMDFLSDDGGLTAILGVVTIKFEAAQLKLILESKILASNLSSEEKETMIDAIRTLPAEGIKHLTTKIIDTGWDNLDTLMKLIGNSIF